MRGGGGVTSHLRHTAPRALGGTQQLLRGEPNGLKGLHGPLLDVDGSVTVCRARDQADQGLLDNPSISDIVGVDSKEAYAALRPEVASDGWLDAREEGARMLRLSRMCR